MWTSRSEAPPGAALRVAGLGLHAIDLTGKLGAEDPHGFQDCWFQ